MRHRKLALAVLGCAISALIACTPQGPPSTRTSSATLKTLPERVAFLEKYVSFRRHYQALDFFIFYRNGAEGLGPSPSEWDINLVAQVPPAEVTQWIVGLSREGAKPKDALQQPLGTVSIADVDEWYRDASRIVGVNRARGIVVYQNSGH